MVSDLPFESLCEFVRYFLFAFLILATHVLSETELSPILFFSSLKFRLPLQLLETHSATFVFLPNQCFPLNLRLPLNHFSLFFCSQPHNVVLSLVILIPNFFSFILKSLNVFLLILNFFLGYFLVISGVNLRDSASA